MAAFCSTAVLTGIEVQAERKRKPKILSLFSTKKARQVQKEYFMKHFHGL
jgi:hypothetical protein